MATRPAAYRVPRDLTAHRTRLAAALDAVLGDAGRAASRLRMLFSGRRNREAARAALGQLQTVMRSAQQPDLDTRLEEMLAALARPSPGEAGLWQDYEDRAVFYNGLLIEVGELTPDVEAGQGFIPAEIAQRVHRYPLACRSCASPCVSVTEAKNRFTEIADRAAAEHDHFTVTRNGRPHVMVVSVAEWDELQETIAVLTDPEARADLAESAEAAQRGDFTTEEEMQAILDTRLGRGDGR